MQILYELQTALKIFVNPSTALMKTETSLSDLHRKRTRRVQLVFYSTLLFQNDFWWHLDVIITLLSMYNVSHWQLLLERMFSCLPYSQLSIWELETLPGDGKTALTRSKHTETRNILYKSCQNSHCPNTEPRPPAHAQAAGVEATWVVSLRPGWHSRAFCLCFAFPLLF